MVCYAMLYYAMSCHAMPRYAPVEKLLSIVLTMHSRHNEFAADRYSVETNGDPEAMVDGLKARPC